MLLPAPAVCWVYGRKIRMQPKVLRAFAALGCVILSSSMLAFAPPSALPPVRAQEAPNQHGPLLLPFITIAPERPSTSTAPLVGPPAPAGWHMPEAEQTPALRAERDGPPIELELLPRPPMLGGFGPHMAGELVLQTERLDVYVGLRTFTPEQVQVAAERLELMLVDNERRFGTELRRRVSIAFYRPSLARYRGIRGLAMTDEGRAEVYYAPHESIDRALVVASHELGHHLQVQRYGNENQKLADTILHEGLATWITGPPWLARNDAISWHQRARQLRAAGIPMRLTSAEDYGADNAYDIWASFVDYLIGAYGWETFDQLYASGRGRAPGSADYTGVLGKPLDEVADDWRAWLDQ